jgi:hypothetical protein
MAQKVTILKERAKKVELNVIGIIEGTIGIQDTIPNSRNHNGIFGSLPL